MVNTDTKAKQHTLKIYTKTGDGGETSLCNGSRTFKDSLRVEAYGSVDEVNSCIGLCVVKTLQNDIKYQLMEIQKELFAVGSNLALPMSRSQEQIGDVKSRIEEMVPKVTEEKIKDLEIWIDKYDLELPTLNKFILAGGTEVSALLHIARTTCRKSERRIVSLMRHEEIDKNIVKYMNRLSDYLFTVARVESHREGKEDHKWISERNPEK